MDDRQVSLEDADAVLQGPHRLGANVLPLDFVPLRLLLQPGGLRIELTRPDMLVGRHSEADIRLPYPTSAAAIAASPSATATGRSST